MEQEVSVDSNVMANDTSRFDGDVQAFSSACKMLRSDCQALYLNMEQLKGMWEGDAFNVLWARFEGDYALLQDAVTHFESFEQSLVYANSAYAACEDKVRAAIEDLDF